MVTKKNIALINSCDQGGGAGNVVWSLFSSFKDRPDLTPWIFVGVKNSNDTNVFLVPNYKAYNSWEKICFGGAAQASRFVGKVKGFGKIKNFFNKIARPKTIFDEFAGREVFNHPGTAHIFDLISGKPDIIHCHNLHYKYFDLRELPSICNIAPVIITLHDSWLLGGHCAHSFSCQKWMSGCGGCPDLKISPPIKVDATAYNLERKRQIYSRCRLNIVTPCQWLMDKVEKSVLNCAVQRKKVIPNGVDTSIFKPADKLEVRKFLGLPENKKILLFVGQGLTDNSWKDYASLKKAFIKLASQSDAGLVLVCLGERRPHEFFYDSEIRFIPYQRDFLQVAKFYQAADLYVHASKIDTFPNSILEALACGVPVVASSVGGIPEQLKTVGNNATGVLVKPGDYQELVNAISFLINDYNALVMLSQNARRDAVERFSLDRMISEYLNFYEEILSEKFK